MKSRCAVWRVTLIRVAYSVSLSSRIFPGFGVGDREPEIEEGGPKFGGSGVEPGGPGTHRCSCEGVALIVLVSLDRPNCGRDVTVVSRRQW